MFWNSSYWTSFCMIKRALFLFWLLFVCFIGLPAAVKNCTYSNQTQISVEIHCIAGYDGGLPQYFVLELVSAQNGRVRYGIPFRCPVHCYIYFKSNFDINLIKLQIQSNQFGWAIFLGRITGNIAFIGWQWRSFVPSCYLLGKPKRSKSKGCPQGFTDWRSRSPFSL